MRSRRQCTMAILSILVCTASMSPLLAQESAQKIRFRNKMDATAVVRVQSEQRRLAGLKPTELVISAGKEATLNLVSQGLFNVEVRAANDNDGFSPLGDLDLRAFAARRQVVDVEGVIRTVNCPRCGFVHDERVGIYLTMYDPAFRQRETVASAYVVEPFTTFDGRTEYDSRARWIVNRADELPQPWSVARPRY